MRIQRALGVIPCAAVTRSTTNTWPYHHDPPPTHSILDCGCCCGCTPNGPPAPPPPPCTPLLLPPTHYILDCGCCCCTPEAPLMEADSV